MDWNNDNIYEDLLYIIAYGQKYKPDYEAPIYEDGENGQTLLGYDTDLHFLFIRRYEKFCNTLPFNRRDYDKDENIQDLIDQLQLDPTSLWYFTLFAYDYTYFLSHVGETVDCAENELEEFAKQILECATRIEDIEPNDEAIQFKEPTSIILQVGKSKKKACLSKSYSIIKLAHLIQDHIRTEKNKEQKLLHNFELIRTDEAMTVRAFRFANMFIEFFNTQEQVISLRRKGASTSEVEKELISKLLQFTTIVKNEDALLDNSYLKSLLKRHNNLTTNTPMVFYQ